MEVALPHSALRPDFETYMMNSEDDQVRGSDFGPDSELDPASINQDTSEQASNIATKESGRSVALDASSQQFPAYRALVNVQSGDFLESMQEGNDVHVTANDQSAALDIPMDAALQERQLANDHGLTQDILSSVDLAVERPLQDGIAPRALHSHQGPEVLCENGAISVDGAANGALVDTSLATDEMNMTAYAKLEFPDTTYLVRTLSVELGRDNSAARRATRMAAETASESEGQSRPSSAGDATHTPMRRARRSTGSCHAFSEEGGIMRWNESSSDSNMRLPRKKKSKAKRLANGPQLALSESQFEAAVAASTMPDQRHAYPPYDACPFLPIHISDDFGVEGYMSISRKHAKIEYSPDKEVFELHVIARNGLFLNSIHYAAGSSVPLRHGDVIQVGPVPITFGLPSNVVEVQQEEFDELSEEADESLVGFDGQSSTEGITSQDGSSEEPVKTIESDEHLSQASGSEGEQLQPRQRTKLKLKALPNRQKPKAPLVLKKGEAKTTFTHKDAKKGKSQKPDKTVDPRRRKKTDQEISLAAIQPDTTEQDGTEDLPLGTDAPPKRKGPGRPPKDGIMSKRERQARAKQAKEAEKARKLGLPPPPPLDLKTKTEKRRLKKEEEEAAAGSHVQNADAASNSPDNTTPITTASNDQAISNEQHKLTKLPKPPVRTPSPEMKESDYTEQQLTRPGANYIVLIHEAITNSKTGQMNLQQIYSAIERKYPWYKFRSGTNGWQSSVRHNLGQNPMFQKVEKEGKGYLWAVKEGATPENQKRKRASPPPMSQHPYYSPGQHAGLPGGPSQPRPAGPAYPPYPQRPAYLPAAPAVVAPPAQNSGSYSSPYATNPPASVPRAPPPPSSLSNGVAYGQLQHPTTNNQISNRPAPNMSRMNGADKASPPTSFPVSLVALLGDDYPKDLPISLPGGSEKLTFEMVSRLQKFKDVFVEVSTTDREHSGFLVVQAIKRIFYPGLIYTPCRQGEEDIVKTLSNLIDPTQERRTAPSGQIPGASPVTHARRAAVGVGQRDGGPLAAVAVETGHSNHGTCRNGIANVPASAPTSATPSAPTISANENNNSHAHSMRPPATPLRESVTVESAPPAIPPQPTVEPLTPTATTAGDHDGLPKRDRETDTELSAAERDRRAGGKRARTEEAEEID